MGLLDTIAGALSLFDDNDCDWLCDECDAHMNDQPGFTTLFGTWTCKECGATNDVSENNIVDVDDDDGYVGNYQYYKDEEKRIREEDEEMWELGIDPYDD